MHPNQCLSHDAIVGGGIFPTHFFGQNIPFHPKPYSRITPNKKKYNLGL
jgi:hypothetical protein